VTVREDVGHNGLGPGTHLLDTHNVWICVGDHPTKIARHSTIDKKVDRKDTEMGHKDWETIQNRHIFRGQKRTMQT